MPYNILSSFGMEPTAITLIINCGMDFGMPSPNRTAAVSTCVELDREQSYSTSVQNNISKSKSEQKDIYNKIIHCVDINVGEIFFWMPQEVLVKHL